VADWWDRSRPPGIAAIGGRVSGNLQVLDFDLNAEEVYPQLAALVEDLSPELVDTLVKVAIPAGGYHHWYRVEGLVSGNTVLALDQNATGKRLSLRRGAKMVMRCYPTHPLSAIISPGPIGCWLVTLPGYRS
jgi:hypothetical protein